ncbi:alpha/beta-hydrolase [Mytilinidion resinicola]|uniref:Alpha/beta-hydrolase n=1 Tax=Mytilinidion resinicola TaxID=574789 RepID=A0A6A6YEX7_9PEZI|nr:alpha/beta-hydrolase [Mytilinidion resinicola]KAF2807128.1 alpha/beta-hydrolase [Mytilinidion resinicola]
MSTTQPQSHPFPTYLLFKALATILRTIYVLFLAYPTPEPISTLSIPSRASKRTIKVHVYAPPSPKPTKLPAPALLNFHGSGYVINMHGSDAPFCRQIAASTNLTVLDCDYRKAPEDPFPAALEDVEDALRYVLSRPDEYDASQIHLSGFSAGGNLALAVCGAPLGDLGTGLIAEKVKKVVVLYPPADLVTSPAAKRAPDGSAGTLPVPIAKLFNACYVAPGQAVGDSRISIRNMAPEAFPREVLVVTCGKDDLAFEAEELASRMAEREGARVEWKRVEGVDHGWDKSCKKGSEDERKREMAYEWAVQFLGEV